MNSVLFFPNLFLFSAWQLRVIELRRLNRTSHCVNTFKTVKVLVYLYLTTQVRIVECDSSFRLKLREGTILLEASGPETDNAESERAASHLKFSIGSSALARMGMLVSAPSPKSWPSTFVDSIRLLALPSMHAQDSSQDTHRSSIGPLGWHSNLILHRYYFYRWPTRWHSNHRYYSYRWYSVRPWFWFPKSESRIFFGSRDRREHLSVLLLAAWEKRLMDSNCLQVEFEILGWFLLATMASLRLQDFLRSNLNHLAVKVASHQFLGSCRQTFHRSLPLEFKTLQQCIIKGPGSLETWFAARLHFTFWAPFPSPCSYHHELALVRYYTQRNWLTPPLLSVEQGFNLSAHSMKTTFLAASEHW